MAAYKPWKDKSFLETHYVKGRKTIDEIAEICKGMGYSVTPMTIYNWCKEFKLIKNSRNLGQRSVGGNPTGKRNGFY